MTYPKQETPCPRQAHGTMASQLAHECVWYNDNWSRRRVWADWFRDRKSRVWDWVEKHLFTLPWRRDRFMGGTYWPDGEPRPRTCSYCGGVHPDDAVTLIMRGWEVESTGKSYKRYLHPPGYRAAIERFHEGMDALKEPRWEGPRSPVPPVKVYTYHFDQRQIDAFNAALDAAHSA